MRNPGYKACALLFLLVLSACATDAPQVSSSRFNPEPSKDPSQPPPTYPALKPPVSISQSFTWTEELMREYSLASQRASNVKPSVATALITIGTLGLLRAAVDPEPRMTGGLAALGLGAYSYGSATQWESRVQIYGTSIKALSCRMDIARPFLPPPATRNQTEPATVLQKARDALAKVYAALPAVEALDAETIIPASTQPAASKAGCSPPPEPCTPPVGAAKDDTYMPRCLAKRKAYEQRCKATSTAERRIAADPLVKASIAAAETHVKKVEAAVRNVEMRLDDSYQAGLWLWIETHWVKGQSDQDLVATAPDLDSLLDKLALKIKPAETAPAATADKGDAGTAGTPQADKGKVPGAAVKSTNTLSAADRSKLNALNQAVAELQRSLWDVSTLDNIYAARPMVTTLSSATCPMPRPKQAVAPAATPVATETTKLTTNIPPDSVGDKVWQELGLPTSPKNIPEFQRRAQICKKDGLKLQNVVDGSITSDIQQRITNGECKGVKYS